MPALTEKPATLDQLREAVCAAPLVQVAGGRTKTALSAPLPRAALLDTRDLRGIIEYEPGEYTFTAYAGTTLAEIGAALAEHGQFLPFDPPFVDAGATIGGTVAAGLSGPGRYRYGGVRDYILGIRYVDGSGEVIKGGGKVVKNAAGFDTPKLMVGSLGMYGLLAELTFKVFPAPRASVSVRLRAGSLDGALAALGRVSGGQMDIHALDLIRGEGEGWELWARLSGLPDALPERMERLQGLLGGGEPLDEAAGMAFWTASREAAWALPDAALVKAPLTPGRIPALERALGGMCVTRRYSGGGQVAWLACTDLAALDRALQPLGPALVVRAPQGAPPSGLAGKVRIGAPPPDSFERRVKGAMDPTGRFPVR